VTDLRDRIAAAIADRMAALSIQQAITPGAIFPGWSFSVADAVIAVMQQENDDIRPALREALASWGDDADNRHHPNCGELSIPDVLYCCQSCGKGMDWCGCRYYCKRCEPTWKK
jgi:hypothetical protein